jgi:rubrerythrin
MNIFNLIDKIQQFDGDAVGRIEHASRRMFMNRIGSKLAATAVPLAFGAIVNKAFAASPMAVDVLKFALTLEYLESEFYMLGNDSGIIPSEYKDVFARIGANEKTHVEFLMTALGAEAPAKPTFDFTAKGMYNPFGDFPTFVTLSKAFEDTGVRAYKGQAPNLMADKPLLEYALQIHSVEARHAAIARKILAKLTDDKKIKGWITNAEGMPAAVYAGEEVVLQGGVNLPGVEGLEKMSFATITEAFDEPLTKAEVLAIATPFIVA